MMGVLMGFPELEGQYLMGLLLLRPKGAVQAKPVQIKPFLRVKAFKKHAKQRHVQVLRAH